MSDERWLEALSKVAREEEQNELADARLDALVEGRLSPDERAALEADAAKDPRLAEQLRAFAPLEDDAIERTFARVAPLVGARAVPVASARRSRFGRIAYIAFPIAAAAALFLFVQNRLPPLPRYSVAIEVAPEITRGPNSASSATGIYVKRGGAIVAVLRPSERPAYGVAGRAYLRSDAGWRPWPAPLEISPEGAVRISGEVGSSLPDRPGAYLARIVVGAPEAIQALDATPPEPAQDAKRAVLDLPFVVLADGESLPR